MQFPRIEKYIQRHILIAICVNLGEIVVGYSLTWTAPVIPILQDEDKTPLPDVISISKASWITSSIYFSVVLAPYLTAWLSNIIGRKWCLLLGSLFATCGYLILSFASHYSVLIIGRIVKGMGVGIIAIVDLVYIGEIAPAHIRGTIVSLTGIFQSLGSLLVFSVGPFVSYQTIGYFILGICALHIVGCFLIPESPLFYAMKGKQFEAFEVLENLGHKDSDVQLKKMVDSIRERKTTFNWRGLFSHKFNRISFYITFPLFFIQQWSGMVAINFYLTTIFDIAESSIDPSIATIIVGFTNLCGTFLVPGVIERAGRRTLLMVSSGGCACCMIVMGLYFFFDQNDSSGVNAVRWLPLTLLIFQNLTYALGLHVIPNTIVGEVFRPNDRSLGSTFVITLGWIVGFLSTIAFGYIVDSVGTHVIFWVYGSVGIIGVLFAIFILPETKGLTLAEIEQMMTS